MPLLVLLFVFTFVSAPVFANSVARHRQGADSKDYPVFPQAPAVSDPALQKKIDHGEYLVKIADCLACHTTEANEGTPFAGGMKIDTPFGAVYSPNITSDKQTGIGGWSDDDFVRAVREGISPDGSYYFPSLDKTMIPVLGYPHKVILNVIRRMATVPIFHCRLRNFRRPSLTYMLHMADEICPPKGRGFNLAHGN